MLENSNSSGESSPNDIHQLNSLRIHVLNLEQENARLLAAKPSGSTAPDPKLLEELTRLRRENDDLKNQRLSAGDAVTSITQGKVR